MVTQLNIIASVNWTKVVSLLLAELHSGMCDLEVTAILIDIKYIEFTANFYNSRTLQELVEHYSKDSDGLCVNLCKPCVQVFVNFINTNVFLFLFKFNSRIFYVFYIDIFFLLLNYFVFFAFESKRLLKTLLFPHKFLFRFVRFIEVFFYPELY